MSAVDTLEYKIRNKAEAELKHKLYEAGQAFKIVTGTLYNSSIIPVIDKDGKHSFDSHSSTLIDAMINEAFTRMKDKIGNTAITDFISKVEDIQYDLNELKHSQETL